MAKKGRKKKGSEEEESAGVVDLPEDYTIAESSVSNFTNFDEFDDSDNDSDNDDYLAGHKGRAVDNESQAALAAESRQGKLQDALSAMEEYTGEKRSAKRESILRSLFKALSQYATGSVGAERVSDYVEAIRKSCWVGLRTGQPPEQYAACRVLQATSVILGADEDTWYESLGRDLTRAFQNTGKPLPVRVAALRALAISCFINASDTESGEALMMLLEDLAQAEYRNETQPLALRTTAIECWSLLATTLDDFHLAGNDDVTTGRGLALLPLLQECLETSSMELQAAAGEAVCLIHEARLDLGIDDEDAKNTTAKRYARGSWEESPWEQIMEEIQILVEALAQESGRHLSKKAKKAQRATFREYAATIVENESPDETLFFRGGSLTLATWKDIVPLGFVRHCLQSGFQIQLLTNPTLQLIFGASHSINDFAGGLSQLEKRLVLSKTSEAAKMADMEMTKQRNKRRNIKNHFLTVDGDDF